MKNLFIFVTLLWVSIAGAQTNLISVNVGDILSGSGIPDLPGLAVKVTDTTPFARNNNGIFIAPIPQTSYSSSAGIAYFTNLIWGNYTITLATVPPVSFPIQVQTNTIGAVDATTLLQNTNTFLNNLTNFYNVSQINSLLSGYFPLIGGVWGTQVETTNLTLMGTDVLTNNFSGAVFLLGTNATFSTSSDLTLTGVGNIPHSTTRIGMLNIIAGANINVNTPSSWRCSDFSTTRICTNGNIMVVEVEVQPNLFTNAFIVQLH